MNNPSPTPAILYALRFLGGAAAALISLAIILASILWRPTIILKMDNCTIRPDFMNGIDTYEIFCPSRS